MSIKNRENFDKYNIFDYRIKEQLIIKYTEKYNETYFQRRIYKILSNL